LLAFDDHSGARPGRLAAGCAPLLLLELVHGSDLGLASKATCPKKPGKVAAKAKKPKRK
jgi:hypothetical protein